ncbi:MAG: hypothetical protein RLZZ297_698 [Chloroflexota bacterium]|jgi:hypothetical protein
MHNLLVGTTSGAFHVRWEQSLADAQVTHLLTEPVIAAATIPGRGVLLAVYNANTDHTHSRLLWFSAQTGQITPASDTVIPSVTSIGVADGQIAIGTHGHKLYTLDEGVLCEDAGFAAAMGSIQRYESNYGEAISQITHDPRDGSAVIAVSTGGLWEHSAAGWCVSDHPTYGSYPEEIDNLVLRCVHGVSVGQRGDRLVQFHRGLKYHDGTQWYDVERPGHKAGFATIYRPAFDDFVAIPLIADEERWAAGGETAFWIVSPRTKTGRAVRFDAQRDYSCSLRSGMTLSGDVVVAGTTSGRLFALAGDTVTQLPHHLGRVLAVAADTTAGGQ